MASCRALVSASPVGASFAHLALRGNGEGRSGAGGDRLGLWTRAHFQSIRCQALHTCRGDDERARECSRLLAYSTGNGSLNGRFDGSSNQENGFALPSEGADAYTFSTATDSFASDVEEDYNDVQESVVASSMKRSLSGCASIKIFGVGGGGCNAVDEMVRSELLNVEFWAVNTDKQALNKSLAPNKIQIGQETTAGRGAG